jgi:mono/diheme cytochrome c family protein
LLVAAQCGIGILLGTRYSATLDGAHARVSEIRADSLLRIVAGAHYWGSAVLIALSWAVVAGMAIGGLADRQRAGAWYGALLLACSSLLLQLTGNLLPLDRHDVQTAVIEAGIAGRIPLAGDALQSLMFQGEAFGPSTLSAWFFAHRWIFTISAALGALILLQGNWGRQGTKGLLLAPTAAAVILALLLPGPSGQAAAPADFDRQDAVVSWYVWPLHGMLRAADSLLPGQGWLGSAVLPALFGVFLLAAPWIGGRSKGALRGGFVAFAALFVLATAFYGGLPAPVSGLQEPPAPSSAAGERVEPIDERLASEGRELFHTLPCHGCHGKDGVGSRAAPSLTTIHERHPNAEWYMRFIKNPPSVKPGSPMPPFGSLADDQLARLSEYLRKPK